MFSPYKHYKQYKHLYQSEIWKARSKLFRQLNPLCVYCKKVGIDTPAEVVDHIIPHKGNKKLFFDINNIQSLCKLHHDSTKKKEERLGCAVGCDENGFPNAGW